MNSLNVLITVPSCFAAIACFALQGCGGPAGIGDQEVGATPELLSQNCPPAVPDPSLEVPAGNELAFDFDAVGVQIYACQALPTGFAWVFVAPEANLLDRHGHVVGTHYAGPTWEAKDGSKVVGARVAGFSPDPTAIPWLLLGAASHDGNGRMANVTYIQRLATTSGLAPAAGCDADHLGATARVGYSATYFFYKASQRVNCKCR